MATWKQITLPVLDAQASKDVVSKLATLSKAVEELTTEQAKYDADLAAVKDVPIEKFTPAMIKTRATLEGKVIDLLQRELSIRGDVLEFINGPMTADHLNLLTRAQERIPQIVKDLKAKLVTLGWVDMDPTHARTAGIHGAIMPGFVQCHPEHVKAMHRKSELEARTNQKFATITEHESAMAEVTARLQSIKTASFQHL